MRNLTWLCICALATGCSTSGGSSGTVGDGGQDALDGGLGDVGPLGDGAVADPDGAVADPDGAVADPDGAVADPDGAVADPDGAVGDPDGAVADPDGAVGDPDGAVDCADGDERVCPRGCEAVQQTCTAGVWSECVYPDEICNGLDDDCDGTIDNAADGPLTVRCYAGPEGTDGVGVCQTGASTCVDGLFGGCEGQVVPAEEICDGEDNDCDGVVDNGVGGTRRRCLTGVGACRTGGVTVCQGADGIQCGAVAGEPSPEVCDGADNDCNGEIDDSPVDTGVECSAGVGACEGRGLTLCDGGALSCDAVVAEPNPETCNEIDDNCNGQIDEGVNCDEYRSCAHALEQGAGESGIYVIRANPELAPRSVWCDQTTDGGGWTLVASTAGGTLNDQSSDYYADLTTLAPAAAHPGIWRDLVALGDRWDVRFACRDTLGAAADPMTVDLSFYDVNWYSEFVAGSDADSCFSEGNGQGADSPVPARRDNVGQRFRAKTDPYGTGYLEGEDQCGDEGDFTVDFDDRGMDGDQADGTDWGEDDNSKKCGDGAVAGGQWFVYVRERPRAATVGLGSDVTTVLREGGILVDPLSYEELAAALTVERYDTLVIGRYTSGRVQLSQPAREALAIFGRNGGNIVTEFEGAAAFMDRYAPEFRFRNTAPAPLKWFDGVVSGGFQLGRNTPVRVLQPDDPIFVGVASPILGNSGTEFFLSLANITPARTLGHEVLATFSGDGGSFPNATYPAITRGRYCGGQFISANFDWKDEPGNPALRDLVVNMVRNASTPPPADLMDACGLRLRPNFAICGTLQDNSSRWQPPGVRVNTCVPSPQLQVMFITRNGEPDPGALRQYVQQGGIVITEYNNAHTIYNAVFSSDVAPAQRFGGCTDDLMPLVQASPQDGFWQDNLFELGVGNGGGCGLDLSGFPMITKLGGWAPESTQLAYRDLGQGRLWLVSADWQDAQPQSAQSDGLLRYMATHAAGGQYGRGGVRAGVVLDRDILSYIDQGFEPCLTMSYADSIDLETVRAQCSGSTLLLGCRQSGDANLVVSAMASRAAVFQDVGDGAAASHQANGVSWYFSEDASMGFAPGGATVNRRSCDTTATDIEERLCWHTVDAEIRRGWSCGAERGFGDDWERVILHRNGDLP